MKIIADVNEWIKIRNGFSETIKIGFVPTMGCLHQGHGSLINDSVKQNDITVLSIFINPTQFNDASDFSRYPKTIEKDLDYARQLNVDYVVTPDVEAMYPEGNSISLITDHPFSNIMEGHYRPGHYNGVLSIVMKLLLLVRPNNIYFGEKDYQQYFLIRELIKKYFIQTNIVMCPIIRESSGLPFSSRNTRLSLTEREQVEMFYQFFYINRPHTLNEIKEKITELGMHLDYFEIHNNRLFLAIKVGPIRIIDNADEANLYVN
ncbi:MAG: pantoate--beta-alanine ligase [Gammaproteobacteria bacterium]|nr:pantoate--beta-alanine ligase [Gammaproteobacteria bacterium]